MLLVASDVDWARKLARVKPSVSYLQRKMLISYTEAMVLMDILEEEGVVSKPIAGKRTILPVSNGDSK